jgi:hypothetical protein
LTEWLPWIQRSSEDSSENENSRTVVRFISAKGNPTRHASWRRRTGGL